jgi:hypothetical protein
MEQENQQTIQKQSLPTKTRIAAWWMLILGIMLIILHLFFYFNPGFGLSLGLESILIYVGIIYLIVSGLLFIKRKWAWWLAILLITPGTLYIVAWMILFTWPFLIPYFLLLIDRKNFFKIAS